LYARVGIEASYSVLGEKVSGSQVLLKDLRLDSFPGRNRA